MSFAIIVLIISGFTSLIFGCLPSSSVLTYDLRNQDPPTENEEGGGTHELEKKETESQSHDSLGALQGKVRRKTRRRRTGQSSFTNSTLPRDVISGSSTMDIACTTEKSIDHLDSIDCTHSSDFGCHASSFTIDHESVQS